MPGWRFAVAVSLAVLAVASLAGCRAGARSVDVRTNRTPTRAPSGTADYYVALGDSVPVWNGSDSYPYQVAKSPVAADIGNLEVVDLACSSETSTTMRFNSLCGGSQYQKALEFLNAHAGRIALITIDIGGNDVLPCVTLSGINASCAANVLGTIDTNLSTMLVGLRHAAGPAVPIVGMNYYDPFLFNWVAGPPYRAVAEATVQALVLLNTRLEDIYSRAGVKVADVESAFHATDLTTMVDSQWGQVPLAVERACTLLDITCVVGQPGGFGDDPNVAGATVIAQAFEAVIGRLTEPPPNPTEPPQASTTSSPPGTTAPPPATTRPPSPTPATTPVPAPAPKLPAPPMEELPRTT